MTRIKKEMSFLKYYLIKNNIELQRYKLKYFSI